MSQSTSKSALVRQPSSNASKSYPGGAVRSGAPDAFGGGSAYGVEMSVRRRVDDLDIVPSELTFGGVSSRPVREAVEFKGGKGKPVFDNTRWGNGPREGWKRGFNFL